MHIDQKLLGYFYFLDILWNLMRLASTPICGYNPCNILLLWYWLILFRIVLLIFFLHLLQYFYKIICRKVLQCKYNMIFAFSTSNAINFYIIHWHETPVLFWDYLTSFILKQKILPFSQELFIYFQFNLGVSCFLGVNSKNPPACRRGI